MPFCIDPVWLAGLVVALTITLWATNALPEYLTALLFFTAAMVLGVAPPEIVFGGFMAQAFWLVLGGFVIGVAMRQVGLADRLAALVSHLVSAGLLVLLTDTPGLLTSDPRVDVSAELLSAVRHTDEVLDRLAAGGAGPLGSGGMLSFELKGGFEAGLACMNKITFCTLAPTLGDVDTLILHPASSSHLNVAKELREENGITDGMIRVSVGIEDIADIIADFEQAIAR